MTQGCMGVLKIGIFEGSGYLGSMSIFRDVTFPQRSWPLIARENYSFPHPLVHFFSIQGTRFDKCVTSIKLDATIFFSHSFVVQWKMTIVHQEFQVPKMEVLNLIAGYFGGGKTPLHKPCPYSLYHGEYLRSRS